MGNYARIGPIGRKSVLLGLNFSLDPVIQTDTPIKQCCNFSRDYLAFETDRYIYFGYHWNKDSGLCQN